MSDFRLTSFGLRADGRRVRRAAEQRDTPALRCDTSCVHKLERFLLLLFTGQLHGRHLSLQPRPPSVKTTPTQTVATRQ